MSLSIWHPLRIPAGAALLALTAAGAIAGGDPPVRLAAPAPVAFDAFGTSVGVSKRTIVVGAPQAFRTGSLPGAAYVFLRSADAWSLEQTLSAPVSAGADGFGNAVAISGDTVLVGAPKTTAGAGAVFVYTRFGAQWTLDQVLAPSDPGADNGFGWSVALEGDTAVVGASRDESLPAVTGAAYVFVRSGFTWTEQQKLTASDESQNAYFGRSVAISRNTALVGAFRDGNNEGAGYVYVRSGTIWTEEQKLTASDRSALSFLGRSVALRGDTALLGAFGESNFRGAAYGFVRTGTTWTQQVKLTDPTAPDAGKFGSSVALSWARSLVGANLDQDRLVHEGVVVLQSRQAGIWTERLRLAKATSDSSALLGDATAMSSGTLVAGARGESGDGLEAGASYVFDTCVPVDVTLPPIWATGTAYAGSIVATGGPVPHAWRVVFGALPDGLALDAQTGTVTGTPTTVGAFFAVIECADAAGNASEIEVPIDVRPPLAFKVQNVPPAVAGKPYQRTFLTTNGAPPNTWSMEGGGTVFVINPATGTVSGTPPVPGEFQITVRSTDATGTAAEPFVTTIRVLDVLAFPKNSIKLTVPGDAHRFERILELVQGTELSVSAKGKKGFAPSTFELLFLTDQVADLDSTLSNTATGFKVKRYAVPYTGRYTLRVMPWGQDAANSIAVTVAVAAPKKVTRTISLADGVQNGFGFGVLTGSKIAVSVKAAKGSSADPHIGVVQANGVIIAVTPVEGPRKTSFKQVTVATGGSFNAALTTRNATSGDVVATAVIKPPKTYVFVDDGVAGADE